MIDYHVPPSKYINPYENYFFWGGDFGSCFLIFSYLPTSLCQTVGDAVAWAMAKEKAIKVSQLLLAWLLSAEHQPVPSMRLDFMVKRLGPGKARVIFGEYCEQGACVLGWQGGPPTIWRACLDAALRGWTSHPATDKKGLKCWRFGSGWLERWPWFGSSTARWSSLWPCPTPGSMIGPWGGVRQVLRSVGCDKSMSLPLHQGSPGSNIHGYWCAAMMPVASCGSDSHWSHEYLGSSQAPSWWIETHTYLYYLILLYYIMLFSCHSLTRQTCHR